MLNEPMMEKLGAMRLTGMVEALKAQQQEPAADELSFHERLAMLVDRQWNWRENQALGRRMKAAKLRGSACIEEIDFRASRGLDKRVIRALAQGSGCETREHLRTRADWRGQEFRRFGAGAKGVPRRLVGVLCPRTGAVSGSAAGAG